MTDRPEDVRITLRLPRDLYDWLMQVAGGDKRRPAASLNRTIVFALRIAKEALEKEPGKMGPARKAA